MADHKGKLEAVMLAKILDEQQRKALVWDVERGAPDRIKRKYSHIKINQIRMIPVDSIQGTVIEIRTIFLSRQTNTLSPCPLLMDHTIAPAAFTQRMILCI